MTSPGINFLHINEGFQPLVKKKREREKEEKIGKKEKRNASRIFFPMKDEIIMAYDYVTNRVLSVRTKISVECSGLPIKEDRMGSF